MVFVKATMGITVPYVDKSQCLNGIFIRRLGRKCDDDGDNDDEMFEIVYRSTVRMLLIMEFRSNSIVNQCSHSLRARLFFVRLRNQN